MTRTDTINSLELSLLPAVLASSCCLTVPALGLLGISVGEDIFYEHRVLLRFIAAGVLGLSLVIFFYKRGIINHATYIQNRKMIFLISLQTILFALVLYVLFLQLFAPILCTITGLGTCQL